MFTTTLGGRDSHYCHLTDEESENIKYLAEGKKDSDGCRQDWSPGGLNSEPPY